MAEQSRVAECAEGRSSLSELSRRTCGWGFAQRGQHEFRVTVVD